MTQATGRHNWGCEHGKESKQSSEEEGTTRCKESQDERESTISKEVEGTSRWRWQEVEVVNMGFKKNKRIAKEKAAADKAAKKKAQKEREEE